MNTTKGEAFNIDQNQQQGEPLRDGKDERILIDALSRATNVAGNQSFDHKISGENRPGGSRLRMELEQRWNDLASSSSTSSTDRPRNGGNTEGSIDCLTSSVTPSSWFQRIYDRHTEPGRHYHTVVHLWEMFELLDIVIESLNKPKWYVSMAWSVFFHDSIYDPKSSRNEKESGELFRLFVNDCMSKSMDKNTFDTAMTMILATEKHKVILPSESSRSMSKTEELEETKMQKHFLDIDMAVLGKQKDAYFTYAALIRKEYEFVPHDVYCSKRAEILNTFLYGNSGNSDSCMDKAVQKKNIYLTESFRGAFEDRARENLRNEIEFLRKNTIPG